MSKIDNTIEKIKIEEWKQLREQAWEDYFTYGQLLANGNGYANHVKRRWIQRQNAASASATYYDGLINENNDNVEIHKKIQVIKAIEGTGRYGNSTMEIERQNASAVQMY